MSNSNPAVKQEATVNRAHGEVLGISPFLSKDALEAYGFDAENIESIVVTVADGEIRLSAGELQSGANLERKEDGSVISLTEAPKELTKSQVNTRYPDESPTDYGEFWERQEKRILAMQNYTCQYCGKDDPSTMAAQHITPPDEFASDELTKAHDITNLVCLCGDCMVDEETGQ
jgi:5-methylcytosine-specific restriction endonuclease McrA